MLTSLVSSVVVSLAELSMNWPGSVLGSVRLFSFFTERSTPLASADMFSRFLPHGFLCVTPTPVWYQESACTVSARWFCLVNSPICCIVPLGGCIVLSVRHWLLHEGRRCHQGPNQWRLPWWRFSSRHLQCS